MWKDYAGYSSWAGMQKPLELLELLPFILIGQPQLALLTHQQPVKSAKGVLLPVLMEFTPSWCFHVTKSDDDILNLCCCQLIQSDTLKRLWYRITELSSAFQSWIWDTTSFLSKPSLWGFMMQQRLCIWAGFPSVQLLWSCWGIKHKWHFHLSSV